MIKNRNYLPQYLNDNSLLGTGVEVGVKNGGFSKHILRHWKGELLYSIDSWQMTNTSAQKGKKYSSNKLTICEELSASGTISTEHVLSTHFNEERYNRSKLALSKFKQRSIILIKTSIDGSKIIPNNSLDFCYIDADHSYESVYEDLNTWFFKVKTGGVLCGHDYALKTGKQRNVIGVKRAVDQFCTEQKLNLTTDTSEGAEPTSWYIEI